MVHVIKNTQKSRLMQVNVNKW